MQDRSFLKAKEAEEARIRSRRKVAGLMLGSAVVAIGLVILFEKTGIVTSKAHQTPAPSINVVHDVKNAQFNFLVPGADDAWQLNSNSMVFDPDKGLMRYQVKLKYANADVTISQQVMPDELKPQTSDKFKNFILTSNVSRSQQAGAGTIYYVAANVNGGPANGADSVIYATDDILLFGRAGSMLSFDAWAKLMTSMKMESKK